MKRRVAVFFLLMLLGLPSLSLGEASTGIYLAPKFLMMLQNTGTLERSHAVPGTGGSYSQFALGGALAAGYDFWPMHLLPIRTEIEFALRGNSEKSWSSGWGETKGFWNTSTLFANVFWDFHNATQFTPYVGAGLGVAFNYAGYDIHRHFGNSFSMDDRFVNFAWNIGAGAAYNFNENIAVDASYRYADFGYTEVESYVGGHKYEIGARPYNHEFSLGLRYTF